MFLSTQADRPDIIEKERQLGVEASITKPFDLIALLTVFERLLR